MTNAEKYKEVFGMEVDPSMCPSTTCDVCPCCSKDSEGNVACVSIRTYEWWSKEYKDDYRAKWGVLA